MSKVKSNKNNKFQSQNNKTRKNISSTNLKLILQFQKEIVLVFLEILLMIKLYHWKTRNYSTHKATDSLYDSFNENIDKFVEVLLGKSGTRIDMTNKKSFKLIDCKSKSELINYINKFKFYLINLDNNKAIQSIKNSDLYNIRDEILANVNQFLYLLTLQ